MSEPFDDAVEPPEQPSFEIRVRVEEGGDVGVLEWRVEAPPDALAAGISHVADDALLGHGLRRLEVYLPVGDVMARQAVHQAGFRLEGVRRRVLEVSPGEYADVCVYGRLADDTVYGPESFSGVMNSVLPRKRCLAHVVFRDADGRLLLLRTRYKEDWELPGGVVEVGESPLEGAQREVAEEIGLEGARLRLVGIDWLPPYLGWEDALQLVFDGGTLTAAQIESLRADPGEIAEMHWLGLEEAENRVAPFALRRLQALLALSDGQIAYLEGGEPPR